ncbi:ComEC/Rec2 family competence protein [Shimia sp. MMG029]|uniref:ComEC/Rec2 family competence protein n=1 Tax=Shimia sp. MMG029 TaxID=3021978 RepID=UPI0022FE10F2|nr:ComEC/Rec2 family competence protein [Shimia sp. MMG029]MDA5555973.1 ComEC/Rec2 family competence protein [Shimia sp. MMG029]
MFTPLRQSVLQQRGHLFCWVPVGLAVGIGLYFSLPVEPAGWLLSAAALIAGCLALFTRKQEADVSACLWGAVMIAMGVAVAGARAHWVAGPVLGFRYYGPIEGSVVAIDRSASDAVRLTLEQVRLARVAPEHTPTRVRISLHSKEAGVVAKPGMLVGTTGHLSPPSGPVEPGGFDFQRHAWFQQIGAVGYTRVPVVRLAPERVGGGIYGFRMQLSKAIQIRMPQNVAGVAAAITTGDRSAIPKETTEILRGANLAHLLAISGLHMGLLSGFVFGAIRFGLALVPYVALRLNTKKVAAICALLAAAGYLVLSGGSVSTERAFVMTAVVLTAALLDRRAFTLRAVAVAAVVVLLLRPEALLGPGFQMSFAATAALIGVFGWLRHTKLPRGPRWVSSVFAVVLSSFVAGIATAPFAAFHFNHITHYGLLANVLSVPVMGAIVMPSAAVAAVFAPLGLEQIPLWVMAQGLHWIVTVADFVSGLEGARGSVKTGGAWVLPLLSLGGVTLLLWQGHARWCGMVLVAIAIWTWHAAPRPDILVSDTGGLVGVMTPAGRALSKAKGQGFVARNWLENDGDMRSQDAAAENWNATGMARGSLNVIHVQGKRGLAAFVACIENDFIVFSEDFEGELPCAYTDAQELKESGAIAVYLNGAEAKRITAREIAGRRIWNDARIRKNVHSAQ